MKLIRFACFSTVFLFAGSVWAQGPTVPSVAPSMLTSPVVTVWVLSLLLGVLHQLVQTGKIFTISTPKAWLPFATAGATILGGITSYLWSQPVLTLNASTLFFAVVTGVGDLIFGSSVAGFAVQMLHVVPGKVLAMKRATTLAKLSTASLGSSDASSPEITR